MLSSRPSFSGKGLEAATVGGAGYSRWRSLIVRKGEWRGLALHIRIVILDLGVVCCLVVLIVVVSCLFLFYFKVVFTIEAILL